jgi:hypothetical protein
VAVGAGALIVLPIDFYAYYHVVKVPCQKIRLAREAGESDFLANLADREYFDVIACLKLILVMNPKCELI